MEKIPLLLIAYDDYEALWEPFFFLLQKYWLQHPTKVYVCSQQKNPESKGFIFVKSPSINKNEKSWSKRLINVLDEIEEDFILLSLDDFYIYDYVDNKAYDEAVTLITNHKEIGCIHFEHRINEEGKSQAYRSSEYYRSFNSKTSNLATTGMTLWRKKLLRCLLNEKENAWEFEYHGGYRMSKLVKWNRTVVLFTDTKYGEKFPFKYHNGGVITGGKLDQDKATFLLNNDNIRIAFKDLQTNTNLRYTKKHRLLRIIKREIHKHLSCIPIILLRKHDF